MALFHTGNAQTADALQEAEEQVKRASLQIQTLNTEIQASRNMAAQYQQSYNFLCEAVREFCFELLGQRYASAQLSDDNPYSNMLPARLLKEAIDAYHYDMDEMQIHMQRVIEQLEKEQKEKENLENQISRLTLRISNMTQNGVIQTAGRDSGVERLNTQHSQSETNIYINEDGSAEVEITANDPDEFESTVGVILNSSAAEPYKAAKQHKGKTMSQLKEERKQKEDGGKIGPKKEEQQAQKEKGLLKEKPLSQKREEPLKDKQQNTQKAENQKIREPEQKNRQKEEQGEQNQDKNKRDDFSVKKKKLIRAEEPSKESDLKEQKKESATAKDSKKNEKKQQDNSLTGKNRGEDFSAKEKEAALKQTPDPEKEQRPKGKEKNCHPEQPQQNKSGEKKESKKATDNQKDTKMTNARANDSPNSEKTKQNVFAEKSERSGCERGTQKKKHNSRTMPNMYMVNIGDMEEQYKNDEGVQSVLKAIGMEGHSRTKFIQQYCDQHAEKKISGTSLGEIIKGLHRNGIIEKEKVDIGNKRICLYRFSDLGEKVFYDLYKQDPALPEWNRVKRDHDNVRHGYLIYEVAEQLQKSALYQEISYGRKENTIRIPKEDGSNTLYIPDIIAKKTDGTCEYYEIEAGGNPMDFVTSKLDKMAMVTDNFYFISPNAEEMEKLTEHVKKWLSTRGQERLRGISVYLGTITRFSAGGWQTVFKTE